MEGDVEKSRASKPLCPYCQSPSSSDFYYGDREFFKCTSCSLIFHAITSAFAKANIEHYQNNYFSQSSQDQLSPTRNSLYEHIIRRIERRQKPGTLLDVGCGRGVFLSIAQRRGWSVTGIDPSIESVREAQRFLGNKVYCTTLETWETDLVFDVITLINVLDHLLNLQEAIRRINTLLSERGLLYLRCPNGLFHSTLARRAAKMKCLSSLPSHLIFHRYSLTPRFIFRLLHNAGFQDIMIRNSSLSGGYKKTTNNFTPSLIERLFHRFVYLSFLSLEIISVRRIVCGPSLDVFAVKGTDKGS